MGICAITGQVLLGDAEREADSRDEHEVSP